MDAQDIIQLIHDSKENPVKLYFKSNSPIEFPNCRQFDSLVIGDWEDIEPVLKANESIIEDYYLETAARNSAIPLLDSKPFMPELSPERSFAITSRSRTMPSL